MPPQCQPSPRQPSYSSSLDTDNISPACIIQLLVCRPIGDANGDSGAHSSRTLDAGELGELGDAGGGSAKPGDAGLAGLLQTTPAP